MTTITTEEACRAVISLIRSDLVEHEDGYDVALKLNELENMASLSSGEQVLVEIAWSLWLGRTGAVIADLGVLDRDNASQVLHILRARYVGTKP